MSGSYERAEATLEELVPTIDAAADHVSFADHFVVTSKSFKFIQATPEYQELRWLRLAILKRRKAGDLALLDGQLILVLIESEFSTPGYIT